MSCSIARGPPGPIFIVVGDPLGPNFVTVKGNPGLGFANIGRYSGTYHIGLCVVEEANLLP